MFSPNPSQVCHWCVRGSYAEPLNLLSQSKTMPQIVGKKVAADDGQTIADSLGA
jgi:hypothetical protein